MFEIHCAVGFVGGGVESAGLGLVCLRGKKMQRKGRWDPCWQVQQRDVDICGTNNRLFSFKTMDNSPFPKHIIEIGPVLASASFNYEFLLR